MSALSIKKICDKAISLKKQVCDTYEYFWQEYGSEIFFKGIFQPFELGGVTRLIPSAVKFCEAGHLKKKNLMIIPREELKTN